MTEQTALLDSFTRYMRVLQGLKESSALAYRQKVEEFFAWLAGNDNTKPAAAITREDIELYLEWCYRKGNGNQTRHMKLTALAKFFRHLRYDRVVDADPTADVPRPRLRKTFMQVFTQAEIYRLFEQTDITREKGLRDAAMLILGALCGLRVGEIVRLTLNDIVDDGEHIDVNVIKTKHEASRRVYLWKAPGVRIRQYLYARVLQGARGHDPLLVSYNRGGRAIGNALNAGNLDTLIKTLASRAGIRRPTVTTHMLRATHANDLQSIKGYTISAIQERMGWKDLSTAGRYLVRRERTHREYNSLHEYWSKFSTLWGSADDNTGKAEAMGSTVQ